MKKRLRQYPKFANPISSLAFNCDGTKLAIAVSYTWDEGEAGLKTAERPAILVRKLGDEVKVSALGLICEFLLRNVPCSLKDGVVIDLSVYLWVLVLSFLSNRFL